MVSLQERCDKAVNSFRSLGGRGHTREACEAGCEANLACAFYNWYSVSGYCHMFLDSCEIRDEAKDGSQFFMRVGGAQVPDNQCLLTHRMTLTRTLCRFQRFQNLRTMGMKCVIRTGRAMFEHSHGQWAEEDIQRSRVPSRAVFRQHATIFKGIRLDTAICGTCVPRRRAHPEEHCRIHGVRWLR